jgi:hypothetical protein
MRRGQRDSAGTARKPLGYTSPRWEMQTTPLPADTSSGGRRICRGWSPAPRPTGTAARGAAVQPQQRIRVALDSLAAKCLSQAKAGGVIA